MRKAVIISVLLFALFGMGIGGVQVDAAGECTNYCVELSNPDTPDPAPLEGQTCICNPLGNAEFTDVLDRILGFLFNIAIVLSPIMILIAGIMFITGAGDPGRIGRAKQILIWTVVGFAVILLSRGLIVVIRGIIGF